MRWCYFALLNVIRNMRRSILAVTIIAVAMVAILTTSGFALFTYQSLAEKAARDEGNFIVTHQDHELEEDTPLQYGLGDISSLHTALNADEAVKAALPRVKFSGLASNGDKSLIFMGLGVDSEEFMVKGPIFSLLEGRLLSSYTDPQALPQLLLAKGLAKSLKVSIGDVVTLMTTTTSGALNAVDFEVIGIYTTGIPELDKRQLYAALDQAQALLNTATISSLSVYLFDLAATAETMSHYQQLEQDYAYTPWWDKAFYYQSVQSLYNRIFGLLGVMLVLLVLFAVSNTMTLSVAERTREIGTLRALGVYQSEILRNFTLEAVTIALIGVVIGVVAAWLVSLVIMMLGIEMPPPPGSEQGYPLVVLFSWHIALMSAVAILVISVLAALRAAHQGCKNTIVEALSHV
ncbi:ABC transporter permease [Pseudoalteromonas sp. SCSIO 43201]|uniref:ABC transporter permease n=1 Tax=Pseudoalteromonas sp. SCSIO 43201 TaxID=2822842 RepID=UPI002075EC7E|nr:FtsX-like permease family protein [Pseudoalteromonas sp. SCSIO 43201]USD28513.1 ABC transporter permease [Pseudoalteromonas sp. SCSIO 43201]